MIPFYEFLNSYEKPSRGRFIENFSGDALDTNRWNTYNIEGTNTYAMADEVDGGFKITTENSSSNDNGVINFGYEYGGSAGVNQFNPNGSVMISVVKMNQTTSSRVRMAMGNTSPNVGHNLAYADLASDGGGLGGNSGKINLRYNKNTSSLGAVGTDVAISTNWVNLKMEFKTPSINLGINGILKCTTTGNNPSALMQPHFYVLDMGYGASAGQIRYIEVWNT